jgi:hypothetical protein
LAQLHECQEQNGKNISRTKENFKFTWQQVNTNNSATLRCCHTLCSDERPSAGRGAQVYHNLPPAKKTKSGCEEE